MSSNNSLEIVTQKELEPVLQNKAFDVKKFLELYEEWLQSHDTHTFAMLRSMHEDAGYNNKNIIFGAEKEMHEIASIIKKFQEEKGQIIALASSGTARVAAENSIPAEPSHIETEYKYELKKYAGYALRELTKNGKTIKDLQEKLKEKKFYSGEITGTFDEVTLEAVFAFQKSVKHPVYGDKGIDGLVGSVETIPALFGIVSKPNTGTTGAPKAPVIAPKSNPTKSSVVSPRVVPIKSPDTNNISKGTIQKSYDDFITYAKSTDKFLAGFRNSQDDIKKIQETLSEKLVKFNTLVAGYIQSGSNPEDINWMRLNIAYYYTDDLSGISSNNQLDIVTSQNLCLDILGKKVQKLPSTEDQLYSTLEKIKTKNPKLADLISNKIAEQQERGQPLNLSIILSNPLVKGGWERAYDEIYGESLKKLDNELDVLKGQKYDTLSDSEKKALNHLRDIRGKDGIFDFTVQNREQMWQMLKYGSAVGAGIAGTALTATGIGAVGGAPLLALSGSIVAGAAVTTAGTLLAQGSHGTTIDIAQEAGINLISFGGGAILFKMASGARAIALAEKTSKVLIYGAEGVGNISIGVGTDALRAKLKGEDLDIYSSIQQNLIWAALPFALRMKGTKVPTEVIADAQQINNLAQVASIQSSLGKPTKTLLEKMKSPLSRLKAWGEKGNVSPKTDMNLDNFKNIHLSGDALYERVTRLGVGNKIDVEGLPGYTIGMTADGRKLEILRPDGNKIQFYKDQLERNLEGIYNLQKRPNPTIDIPVQPTESVSPTNNGASSHSTHPISETVVPVAPHVASQGVVPRSAPAATSHDTHAVPPAANTAQAHTTHQESSAHHADHGAHPVQKSSYEFKGLKTIDTILMGDNRKFRELLPFADNNVFQGTKKLATGEMRIIEAMHNSAAWVQNQTFSQIYREMAKPWRGNPSAVIKNAGDNIRTVLLSGESGKWMSADRLGKLGIVMSAGAIDYVTSDEFQKNSDGLIDAVQGGAGFIFNKYALNPHETMKLFQEIILLNWVAIMIKESGSFVGAGTGVATRTVEKVQERLK